MVAIGHLVLLFSSLTSSVSGIDDKKMVTKLLRSKIDPQGSFLQKESLDVDLTSLTQKQRDAVRRNENLVDWTDGHKAEQSTLDAEELDKLDAGITADAYHATLTSFLEASGTSRYVRDPGNQLAAKYLEEKFKAAGFRILKVPESSTGLKNVIAFKEGSDPKIGHETVLFGAHFDSVNYKTPGVDAPGVDDNGSGVACLLSIAEAMKDQKPKRSMAFVAFNSEEEGLLGSAALVRSINEDKQPGELTNIKAALIADEVAFPGRKMFNNQAIFETDRSVEGVQELVDTFAHSHQDVDGQVASFKVNFDGFGSDHMSFLRAGIPALLLIERDDEWHAAKVGHSSMDNFNDGELSMDYGATMTRLGLRSFAKLANPAPPL